MSRALRRNASSSFRTHLSGSWMASSSGVDSSRRPPEGAQRRSICRMLSLCAPSPRQNSCGDTASSP
eukprot:1900869-Pyramimonas_sp.AAC.1